jgi:hypothetical protein
MAKQLWIGNAGAVTGFTGAAPQTVAGASINTQECVSLSVIHYAKATITLAKQVLFANDYYLLSWNSILFNGWLPSL